MGMPVVYLSILFVMILWGFNVIAIKVLVEQFAPVTITSLRILIAAIVVWIILWKHNHIRLPEHKEILYVFLAALTGVLSHHFFLAVGLTRTTASSTGLILGTVPLATSILAAILLKERLSVLRISGLILGLIGVSIVVLAGSSGALSVNPGDIYIFLAVLSQALSFIYIKKASETMRASLITGFILLIGAVLLFITSLVMEPAGLSSLKNGTVIGWGAFLASGILASGVGHFLYNYAIQYIGAGKTSIFLNMSPFFALTGAYLFLNEMIRIEQILAFLLIVISVILGSGLGDKYIKKKRDSAETETRVNKTQY